MFLIKSPSFDPFTKLTEKEAETPWFSPAVDIFESKDAWVIKADLPGLKRDDIKVEMDGDTLTLVAEAPKAAEEAWLSERLERSPRAWRRSFNLGENISREGVKATYDSGVLTLELKKVEKALARQIEVC